MLDYNDMNIPKIASKIEHADTWYYTVNQKKVTVYF